MASTASTFGQEIQTLLIRCNEAATDPRPLFAHLLSLHEKLFPDSEDLSAIQQAVCPMMRTIAADLLMYLGAHLSDISVIEICILLLYHLSFCDPYRPAFVQHLAQGERSTGLFKVLQQYSGNHEIVGRTCTVIAAASPFEAELTNVCRTNGALEFILRFAKSASTPDVAGQCLAAVQALAGQEQNVQFLIRRGAVLTLLDMVQTHAHTPGSRVLVSVLNTLAVICLTDTGADSVARLNSVSCFTQLLRDPLVEDKGKQAAADLQRLLLARSDTARRQLFLGPSFRQALRELFSDPQNLSDNELCGVINAFLEMAGMTQLPIPLKDEISFISPDLHRAVFDDAKSIATTLASFSPELAGPSTSSDVPPCSIPPIPKPKVRLRPCTQSTPLIHRHTGEMFASPELPVEPLYIIPCSAKRRVILQTLRRMTDPSEILNHVVFDDVTRPITSPLVPCPFPTTPTLAASTEIPRPPPFSRTASQPLLQARNISLPSSEDKTASMPGPKLKIALKLKEARQPNGCRQPRVLGPSNDLMVTGQKRSSHLSPSLEPGVQTGPSRPASPPLRFTSQFESGNLRRAIRIYETEYDLILNHDLGTDQYSQWFYFMVEGMQPGVTYRFNFLNMEKAVSQFDSGQQPVIFSEKEYCQSGRGWVRGGYDICYLRNVYKRQKRRAGAPDALHSTLHLAIKFPHLDDRVFIAHSPPYTYTDLQQHLLSLYTRHAQLSTYFLQQVLCRTLGDNHCYLLTITNLAEESPVPLSQRPVIFISGRVHPGETAASWMIKGLIDFLVDGQHPHAQWLRDHFVWKIVPMLNPDGVINGNSRCSLAGVDLNRQWADCTRQKYPTIYWLKQYMRYVRRQEKRTILLYCDFHGHSQEKNVFMYGCKDSSGLQLEEMLPSLLAKRLPYFSLESCCYKVQKAKSAGRIVAFQELGILLSYTLEASLCGGNGQVDSKTIQRDADPHHGAAHFHAGHYCYVGQCFALAIQSLVNLSVNGTMFMELLQSQRTAATPGSPIAPVSPAQLRPSQSNDDDEDEDGDSGER